MKVKIVDISKMWDTTIYDDDIPTSNNFQQNDICELEWLEDDYSRFRLLKFESMGELVKGFKQYNSQDFVTDEKMSFGINAFGVTDNNGLYDNEEFWEEIEEDESE